MVFLLLIQKSFSSGSVASTIENEPESFATYLETFLPYEDPTSPESDFTGDKADFLEDLAENYTNAEHSDPE